MLTIDSDGSVIIRFTGRIRPKGSHKAIMSKSTNRPIVLDQDATGQKLEKAMRARLKAECEGRHFTMLDGPLQVSGRVWFKMPGHTTQEAPFSLGDTDKLLRRLLDILGGNRNDPGPVLADDKYVRRIGMFEAVWADEIGREDDGALLKLTKLTPRVRLL